jgi:L-fuculose-phosphate aldolase
MIAAAGGANVRCAPYATFGTQALSDHAVAALIDRRACLLANHGLIALGADLERARRTAVEVEELARQYLLAEQTGHLVLLSASEIDEAIAMFSSYGQQKT